jgi:hypothetical protein
VSWPDEDDPDYTERRAPFTLKSPGPQPSGSIALEVVLLRIRKKHRATPTGRIGLIAADRPADVLPAIGWEGLVNRGSLYCR